MVVRDINVNDIPAVAKLAIKTYREVFGKTMSDDELQKSLKSRDESYFRSVIDSDTILVALDGNQTVGFIQLGAANYESIVTSNKDIELKKIYIDEAFQGKGVGNKLMDEMFSHKRLIGIENIYLDVYEKNEKALGLYKKYGFTIIGKTPFEADGKIIGHDLLMKYTFTQNTASH